MHRRASEPGFPQLGCTYRFLLFSCHLCHVLSKRPSSVQLLRCRCRLPLFASGILALLGFYMCVSRSSRPSLAATCIDLSLAGLFVGAKGLSLGTGKLQRTVRNSLFEGTLDRFGGNVEPTALRDHFAEVRRLLEIRRGAQNFLN
jgi:hypothetical protein